MEQLYRKSKYTSARPRKFTDVNRIRISALWNTRRRGKQYKEQADGILSGDMTVEEVVIAL